MEFELRAAQKDRFAGGSFALPGGKTYDIGARLKSGDGRIVTDDPAIVDRLKHVPALKEAPPKESSGAGKSSTASDSAGSSS